MLNRESFLQVQDLKTIDVSVPEWNETVRLRQLTAAETNRLYRVANAGGSFNADVFQTTLIAMSMIDDSGAHVVPEESAGDLSSHSNLAVARLFNAAKKLNKLGTEEVDDVEKNLPDALSAASS